MKVKILDIYDAGEDRLRVEAEVDGRLVIAYGWVSALTNHFDEDAYAKDGDRKKGAKAREMTREERREYCERLVREAVVASEPKKLKL